MKSRASTYALALCAGMVTAGITMAPTPARAQGGDATTEMARQRFQEGVKFYDARQFGKARAAFLQAWALKHHPAVLLNLAQSELRSGHEADAANHFAQYLRDSATAGSPEHQEAEKGLSSAKAKVGKVTITAAAGAEIFVDGDPVGRAPLPAAIFMKPGPHSIESRHQGKTLSASIAAIAGQATSANLAAGTASSAPAASPPGAAAPPLESGSAAPPEADQGAEGASFSTSDKRYESAPKWFKRQKIAWIGAGVTGLGLVGGVVFALSAKNKYGAADDTKLAILREANKDGINASPCDHLQQTPSPEQYAAACQRFQNERDDGDSFKGLATASFVVAGLAAAGTVVFYFVNRKRLDDQSARVAGVRTAFVPVLTPRAGALSVVGQF